MCADTAPAQRIQRNSPGVVDAETLDSGRESCPDTHPRTSIIRQKGSNRSTATSSPVPTFVAAQRRGHSAASLPVPTGVAAQQRGHSAASSSVPTCVAAQQRGYSAASPTVPACVAITQPASGDADMSTTTTRSGRHVHKPKRYR
jgi:hypothetical protein